jgi:hypothetical protein
VVPFPSSRQTNRSFRKSSPFTELRQITLIFLSEG